MQKENTSHKTYFIAQGDKSDEGEELFAYAVSEGYKDYKGLGWVLLLEHETEELFVSVTKLKNDVLAISLLITALAITLGFLISRNIANSVKKLAVAAAEIGKGNLDTEIEINSKDEIGILANAFNDMAEDLRSNTTSIDNLNAVNQQLQTEIAERKQIEKELEDLAKFPSENPNPILRIAKDGEVLYSNKAGELLLTKWESGAGETVPEKWQNTITKAFTSGKGIEEVIVEDRIFSVTIAPIKEAGYVNLYASDITESKQSEEELLRYACIVSSSSDMMAMLDANFVYLATNEAYLTAFDLIRGEVVGHSPVEVFGEEFFETVIKPHADRCLEGNKICYENWFNFPALGQRYMLITYSPYIDQNGEQNGFIVNACDITEREQAEEQLRKNEHQYRTLVENLPQRILLKDRDSVFISCNEHYAKEFDMTPAEMVGKTDYDFYKKQSADKYRASDSEVLKSRERKDDYITLTEDDKEKIIHVVKTPVIDNESEDGDELVGVLCIFEDVTRQKQAERSAEKAYGELHEAHEELKGVQSQIIQNEKLASIGQLAAGVAHEINNPMGFVSSNFETLQSYVKKFQSLFDIYSEFVKEAKNEGGKKMLKKVEEIEELREDTQIDFVIEDIEGLFSDMQEGLGRITNIVQNLRDFSRIDQRGELAEYDLNDGIKSTLVVARNEIKYDAKVKTDFSEVPLILCNSGQINQVFLNILINAAQAIKSQEKKKKGTITIKTYVEDEDVICEITDDGPGIAPDKVSKIFDPFFTTKAPGKGTRLGLSVSHDIIVNKHKGTLLVDSTVGEGTKFTIRLPIKCEITEGTDEI